MELDDFYAFRKRLVLILLLLFILPTFRSCMDVTIGYPVPVTDIVLENTQKSDFFWWAIPINILVLMGAFLILSKYYKEQTPENQKTIFSGTNILKSYIVFQTVVVGITIISALFKAKFEFFGVVGIVIMGGPLSLNMVLLDLFHLNSLVLASIIVVVIQTLFFGAIFFIGYKTEGQNKARSRITMMMIIIIVIDLAIIFFTSSPGSFG